MCKNHDYLPGKKSPYYDSCGLDRFFNDRVDCDCVCRIVGVTGSFHLPQMIFVIHRSGHFNPRGQKGKTGSEAILIVMISVVDSFHFSQQMQLSAFHLFRSCCQSDCDDLSICVCSSCSKQLRLPDGFVGPREDAHH